MKQINLIIENCYDCEEYSLLKDADKNIVIMSGDDYHDNIDSMIDGFMKAISYLHIESSVEHKKIVCHDHE